MKKFLKKYFNYLYFFYGYLRIKLFIYLILNIIVGVLDGFGLVMFLPLLQMVDGTEKIELNDLGGVAFMIDGLNNIGIQLNLGSILLIMLSFFLLKGIFKFFELNYRIILRNQFVKSLRLKGVNQLSNLDYKAFMKSDAGRIQNTLSGEIGNIAGAFEFYFLMLQALLMVMVYFTLAFFANPQFSIIVISGGLISNFIFHFFNKKTILTSLQITSGAHIYQGLLLQMVAFFKYLKATDQINDFKEKLETKIEEINEQNLKIGLYSAILNSSKEPIVITVVVFVILLQTMIFEQKLGLIILSLMLFYRSLTFLLSFQNNYNSFLGISGSIENIRKFLKTFEADKENFSKENYIGFNHSINLQNISFSYDKENAILINISLIIPKNQTIAIIGESGSGKSTLFNIIAGLLKPESGKILFDSKYLENIDLRSYRRKIGYITQEPVIFSDSIYNNVTFWSPKTNENMNKFWQVLEQSHIAEFVKKLPDVEDEKLGDNGILISGGQKQRIAIARELFKEVDILLMDEATSSLDSGTENIIKENIDKLKGKYTIVIVAHRLSTIKNADKIILLSKGEIIATDEFNALLSSSPEFKKMVSLQEF